MQSTPTSACHNFLTRGPLPANKRTPIQTDQRRPLLTPSSSNSQQGTPSNRLSQKQPEFHFAHHHQSKHKLADPQSNNPQKQKKKQQDLCRSGYSFKTLDSVLSESHHDKKYLSKGDFQQSQVRLPDIHPFDCSEFASPASARLQEPGGRESPQQRKFAPQKTLENITSTPTSSLKKQASLIVNIYSPRYSNPCIQLKAAPAAKKNPAKKPRKRLLPSEPTTAPPANKLQTPIDQLGSPEAFASERLELNEEFPSFSADSDEEQVENAPSSKVSNSESTEISPVGHQPNRSSVSWNNFDAFVEGIAAQAGQCSNSRQQAFHMQVERVPSSTRQSDGCRRDQPKPRGLFDLFH
jgi:hypothetical protein